MKKENYGIPTMLLCVGLYVLGLCSAVGTFWPIVAATVLVFVLQFDSNVKKTAVQSLALALIVSAVYIVFDVFDVFIQMIDTYARLRSDNGFIKFMDTLRDLVKLATYIVYAVLIICAAIKNDIFVGKTHLVVDGFVPAKPMPQQMYNGGQQQYNGGQPMNNAAQMNGGQSMSNGQQMRGAQPMNGQQPMHGAQQMNTNAQQMHSAQPMNNGQMYTGGQNPYSNGAQSMNGQSFKQNNSQNNNQPSNQR